LKKEILLKVNFSYARSSLEMKFESTKVDLIYFIHANLDSRFEIKVKCLHANKMVTKEYFDFDEVEKEKRSLQHEIP
jgi:hypothetical protein